MVALLRKYSSVMSLRDLEPKKSVIHRATLVNRLFCRCRQVVVDRRQEKSLSRTNILRQRSRKNLFRRTEYRRASRLLPCATPCPASCNSGRQFVLCSANERCFDSLPHDRADLVYVFKPNNTKYYRRHILFKVVLTSNTTLTYEPYWTSNFRVSEGRFAFCFCQPHSRF